MQRMLNLCRRCHASFVREGGTFFTHTHTHHNVLGASFTHISADAHTNRNHIVPGNFIYSKHLKEMRARARARACSSSLLCCAVSAHLRGADIRFLAGTLCGMSLVAHRQTFRRAFCSLTPFCGVRNRIAIVGIFQRAVFETFFFLNNLSNTIVLNYIFSIDYKIYFFSYVLITFLVGKPHNH